MNLQMASRTSASSTSASHNRSSDARQDGKRDRRPVRDAAAIHALASSSRTVRCERSFRGRQGSKSHGKEPNKEKQDPDCSDESMG